MLSFSFFKIRVKHANTVLCCAVAALTVSGDALCLTCVRRGVEHLQSVRHAVGKQRGVLFAAKVEAPHLPRVPPLVEVGRGLVVLKSPHDWTVYDHLKGGSSEGGRWTTVKNEIIIEEKRKET